MHCKICGGTELLHRGHPRIAARFAAGDFNKYSIVQCRSCGFYLIDPDIDLDQDQWRAINEDNYFVTDQSPWKTRLKIREAGSRLSYIAGSGTGGTVKFLDMGCGEGFVLKEALARQWNAHGLDIADNLAPDIDRNDVHFFRGNLFDARYPAAYFDVIYMDSVLEHIDHPVATLRELFRILKPGGRFFTIVPNEDCLENRMKKLLYAVALKKHVYGVIKPFYPPFHIQGFNKRSIRTALEASGFTVTDLADLRQHLSLLAGVRFSLPAVYPGNGAVSGRPAFGVHGQATAGAGVFPETSLRKGAVIRWPEMIPPGGSSAAKQRPVQSARRNRSGS